MKTTLTIPILALATLVAAPTLQAATLVVSEDAFIQQSSANTNFGTANVLQVKNNTDNFDRKAYMKLDLDGIGEIETASMTFTVSNSGGTAAGTLGGARDYEIYGMTDTSWIESGAGGITWNNAPGNDDTGSFTDPPATLLGTVSVAGGSSAVTFSFTDSVNPDALDFLNDNLGDEISFMLFRSNNNASVDYFFSTESGFAAPTLTYTQVVPEPSTFALAGALGGLLLLRRRRG